MPKFRSYKLKKTESTSELIENSISPEMLLENPLKDCKLNDFQFNILEETNIVEKQRLVWAILNTNFFIHEFKIPINTLCEFLDIIKIKYNSNKNPFHNFDHGFSGISIEFPFKIPKIN